MNDLPQNELFSAYLDGELTAAEQAEIERLLATNPAARQLLDELRALSATLQALPQQKVGEDLSQRVLRVAERRMLAGEESRQTEPPPLPVPLGRSIFRRFTRPRTLVWLGLTAAVALVIVINERSHRVEQGGEAGKEVALAPPQFEKALAHYNTPPSIQAAPEPARETARDATSAAFNKRINEPLPGAAPEPFADNLSLVVTPEKKPAMNYALDAGAERKRLSDSESAAAAPAEAPAITPSDSMRKNAFQSLSSQPVPEESRRELRDLERGGDADKAVVAKRLAGETQKAAGGRMIVAEESEEVGANMLVVRCDMSPLAVQNGAFDKLLISNGIAWQEDRDQLAQDGKGQTSIERDKLARKPQEKSDTATDRKTEPADAADELELVYVEASPAQVTATLAGLSAQPEAFPAISIQPERGEAVGGTNWQELVRRHLSNYASQPKPAATALKQTGPAKTLAKVRAEPDKTELAVESIESLDASSVAAQGRAQRIQQPGYGWKYKEQSQLGAARQDAPLPTLAGSQAQALAGAAQRASQSSTRAQINQSAQSRAQQQVLFVLRVVGGNPSNPQAVKVPAGADSKAAKPAKSAAPAPARSTTEK